MSLLQSAQILRCELHLKS